MEYIPKEGLSMQYKPLGNTGMNVSRVVYISCNPETQARDLRFLTTHGYKVKKIQPVDMFPHTSHIECVVLLSRAQAK